MAKIMLDGEDIGKRLDAIEHTIKHLTDLVQLFADRVKEMDAWIHKQCEHKEVQ